MKNAKKLLVLFIALVVVVGMTGCKAGCGCPQW
jgi:sulfite reductase beta subunit-like hemoprotein